MDRVRAGLLRRANLLLGEQVAEHLDRLVRRAGVQRARVVRRDDRDGCDPELPARAEDAQRDLPAVGDEQLLDGHRTPAGVRFRPARAAFSAKRIAAAGNLLRALQRLLERGGEVLDVRFGHGQRRDALEHVHVVAGGLDQDRVLGEERHRHQLAEDPRLRPLDQAPRPASSLRLVELDRPEQSETAHVADDVVALEQRLRSLEQQVAEARGAFDQALLVQLVERGEAGGHGQVVRREGRAVADRVLERVEDVVVDLTAHQARPHRHVAARERFRDGDDVGLEAPVLEGEHLPGASEAGLHLVQREVRPVPAAELLRALQVARRGEVHALALHGLDQEQGDILALQFPLERVEVVPGDLVEVGKERPEALRPLGAAVGRERAESEAVEALARRQHA